MPIPFFHIMRHAAVGLGIAMVDQTFDTAEAGRHFDHIHVFNHAVCRFARIVFEVKPLPRRLCLWAFGFSPVRNVRETAVRDRTLFHGGMGFKAAGDVKRVFAVRLHAQGERFDAAQHQPAVHRAGNRAGMHHHVVQRFRQFFGFDGDDAHQYVGVSAKIFGSGVEHDVAAPSPAAVADTAWRRCCRCPTNAPGRRWGFGGKRF